jgi:flagellar basal-body rod protein FlgG
MLRSLQTAATGMDAQSQLIDNLSNNIANVNTIGFKKSRSHFNDLMYQHLRAPGMSTSIGTVNPSGVQVGNGVRLSATDKVFTEGSVKVTEKDMDFMIKGAGFFRIQMPDGSTGYTRDGAFQRSSEGKLVTSEGLSLAPDIIVPPETKRIDVGLDGTVTASIQGEDAPRQLGQIQIATFVNPAGLQSIGRNLYLPSSASGEAIVGNPGENGTGNLSQGELESSNVNIVEEMIQMIMGQRAYELNSKVIKTGDEMMASTNQIR